MYALETLEAMSVFVRMQNTVLVGGVLKLIQHSVLPHAVLVSQHTPLWTIFSVHTGDGA